MANQPAIRAVDHAGLGSVADAEVATGSECIYRAYFTETALARLDVPARASVVIDRERCVTIALFGPRVVDAEALELRLGGNLAGHFVQGDRRTDPIEVERARGWNELTVASGTPDDIVPADAGPDTAGGWARRGLLLERFDISAQDSAGDAGSAHHAQLESRIEW